MEKHFLAKKAKRDKQEQKIEAKKRKVKMTKKLAKGIPGLQLQSELNKRSPQGILFFYPEAPGSNPKHTVYTFLEFNWFYLTDISICPRICNSMGKMNQKSQFNEMCSRLAIFYNKT